MRFAIIGDIHSNLTAFQAVLHDLESRGGFDKIWCLGDVVGYGPDPHECIELLRSYDHICVAGNHDWAVVGKINTVYFNEYATAACEWTEGQLAPTDVTYLTDLPTTITEGDFTLVHGSPRDPIMEYLVAAKDAQENLSYFDTKYCLVSHSHVPLLFKMREEYGVDFLRFTEDKPLKLEDNRLIINPGSIGQPRDNDPRASYSLYDTESGIMAHFRVEYDIRSTQQRMLQVGLPQFLITRLSYGW